MRLEQQLAKSKRAILDKWFAAVVDTYPADTARFLKSQKDPFANPVGNTTFSGLNILLDNLTGAMDGAAIANALDPIIRIRAVQNFSASHAVGFVFQLKSILRQHNPEAMQDATQFAQLLEIEKRIDVIGMAAFDIYMFCKEKLYELRSTMERDRLYKAFRRAGLIAEIADAVPEEKVS